MIKSSSIKIIQPKLDQTNHAALISKRSIQKYLRFVL